MKFIYGLIILLCMNACNEIGNTAKSEKETVSQEAVDTLRVVLHKQQEWVKLHAAEFLIWSGNPGGVKEIYGEELQKFNDKSPYRIGIWRVLSQLSDGAERKDYEQKVLHAFLDTSGKDRLHAVETLGKLKLSPYHAAPGVTKAALESDNAALYGYSNWAMAYTDQNAMLDAQKYFYKQLMNPAADITLRRIAAYVLRYIQGVSPAQWNELASYMMSIPNGADGRIGFLTTVVILADEASEKTDLYQSVYNALLEYRTEKNKGVRIELANALAVKGTRNDIAMLVEWMRNLSPTGVAADDADVQASAAYAILKLFSRDMTSN